MNAAIYTRISLDRTGDSFSPERQETLCRQLATGRGWTVKKVYTDRDISGWKDVRRPGFEAMLKAVERGEVQAVIAYSLVRLGRRAARLGDLLEKLNERGVALALVDMNIDTTSPAGEMLFGVVAQLAQLESRQISERVKSFERVAASRGQIHSGGYRHYGYERDGTVVEEEAIVVREIVARLGRGESLRSVATGLNERGLRTVTGKEWYASNLRGLVRSPRIVGVRSHVVLEGGRVVSDDRTRGDWQPIVTEAAQQAAMDVLALNQTKVRPVVAPTYLLNGGLAVCGKCGMPMQGSKARGRYRCFSQPGSPACGGLTVMIDRLDETVAAKLLDFVAGATMSMADDSGRTLADLERLADEDTTALARLNRLCFIDRTLTEDEWRPLRDEAAGRLERTKADLSNLRLATAEQAGALPPGDRAALQTWWDGATLEDRRAAVRAAVKAVVVKPKGLDGHRFDPERVELQWRMPFVLEGGRQRWLTMTDEEKEQARLTDEAARADLEATERASADETG